VNLTAAWSFSFATAAYAPDMISQLLFDTITNSDDLSIDVRAGQLAVGLLHPIH
jgi:hypothetical protein